jgi:predicted anti-sigma-YlaC factor YlaD
MAHIAHRLQAFLSDGLSRSEREQVEAHLSACPQCREERDLLADAAALISPLPPREPRAGFAAMVALNARDRAPFVRWLRWSVGGVAAAGAAAVAVAMLIPAARPWHSEEVRIAQRLDLFEDLAVVQHREALEDLEVVAVLHTLEARP